jgi:hypothetical protein
MKARPVLLALVLMTASLPTQWAVAQANYRSAVDRQQKQAQACQDKQNKKFKAIERDADCLLQDVAKRNASSEVVPSSNQSRQRP